jgi:hypothetical protein
LKNIRKVHTQYVLNREVWAKQAACLMALAAKIVWQRGKVLLLMDHLADYP